MANPQKENGHTQIANEIMDNLAKIYLSPNQWQVLICIIRKTYGFNKKVDYIANLQIQNATRLKKEVVSRVLSRLEKRGIIIRKGKHIGIQKDWEKWLTKQSTLDTKLAEQSTNKKVSRTVNRSCINSQPKLTKHTTKVSSPVVTQKKDTIQKTLYKRKYGEFLNVLLSDEEYKKLIERFGEKKTRDLIEELSIAKKSKGYKYKDDYATILNWERRKNKEAQVVKRNPRSIPKQYTRPEDL